MGPVDRPLSGLVVIALVTMICGAVVGGVLHEAELAHGLRRRVDRISPPAPNPEGPPIERRACDVRRLRREFLTVAPDIPTVRLIGLLRAYNRRVGRTRAQPCRSRTP
jgi:hypothetical protein